MHENIWARVLIVWELIDIIEYCHLLEKGSESALMYCDFLPTSQPAYTEITCSLASLHPSEQVHKHENIWARVPIVWELIDITEYCHLLEKGSKSALMYHEILPTSTHAKTEISCS